MRRTSGTPQRVPKRANAADGPFSAALLDWQRYLQLPGDSDDFLPHLLVDQHPFPQPVRPLGPRALPRNSDVGHARCPPRGFHFLKMGFDAVLEDAGVGEGAWIEGNKEISLVIMPLLDRLPERSTHLRAEEGTREEAEEQAEAESLVAGKGGEGPLGC